MDMVKYRRWMLSRTRLGSVKVKYCFYQLDWADDWLWVMLSLLKFGINRLVVRLINVKNEVYEYRDR